jgi:hypothetical protein
MQMTDKNAHFIPHPLCQDDPKVPRTNLENLDKYVEDSPNPRWAASFLVRAIASGLSKVDMKMSDALRELANTLASRGNSIDVSMTCANHAIVPVFVTHTGYIVQQCKACGQGDVVAPPKNEQPTEESK